MTNYLPFIRRAYVTANVESVDFGPAGFLYRMGRVATRIQDLAYGRGVRAHLGEVEVRLDGAWNGATPIEVDNDVYSALSMRIGVLGRGYLTENFHPIAGFRNGPPHECGTWLFPKPYTIYPGQRLAARFQSNTMATIKAVRPAIQYNGKRVVDGKPIILYDVADTNATAAGQVFMLNADTLQCPHDSPVELYSVTGPYDPYAYEQDFAMWEQMLYYADGEKMWSDERWQLAIDPKNNVIDLNKPQWVMKTTEILTFEFEILPDPGMTANATDGEHYPMLVTSLRLAVTLRGSLEVE